MDETYSEEQWKRFTHGAYLPYRQPFQSGVENVILALDMGDDPRSAVNNLARDISLPIGTWMEQHSKTLQPIC